MLNQQINKAFEKSNKVLAELKRLHEYINDNHKSISRVLRSLTGKSDLGIYDYDSTNQSNQLIIETAAFNHIINGGKPKEYLRLC